MSLFTLVVPLYRSQPNLPRLLPALQALAKRVPCDFEAVLVNDGSPDDCEEILLRELPGLGLQARVVHLSRNFGAFAAIAAGLREGRGDYFAVLAADLQEPPELALEFLSIMAAGKAEVVFGTRTTRSDPFLATLASNAFWRIYRSFVNPEIPKGGIDVFGCTRQVRDHLCSLGEVETNLIALLFWLGFRRKFVAYERQPRREGTSAWTFAKKLRYSLNSIFSFTDLPLLILQTSGILGVSLSILAGTVVLFARLGGYIQTVGYTPIVLAVLLFGGLTALGLGILGQYLWIALQNARRRPPFVIRDVQEFGTKDVQGQQDSQGASKQTTA